MPKPEDPDFEVVRRMANKNKSTVAQQEMDYTLWKFSTDVHEIADGEFPAGERLAVVHGLVVGVEQAKLIIKRDPTVAFIQLVPKRPGIFCKTVRVAPKVIRGSSRQTLDPDEGLDEYRRGL